VGVSLAILALEFVTGPFVQFPILFVLPVAMAATAGGWRWGVALAAALPSARLSFGAFWGVPRSWPLAVADAAVDLIVLAGFAVLVALLVQQQREIRVLRGLLPICCFCKRIRTESEEWQQVDQYITEHSEAQFSHTFCPECGREHYGEYLA